MFYFDLNMPTELYRYWIPMVSDEMYKKSQQIINFTWMKLKILNKGRVSNRSVPQERHYGEMGKGRKARGKGRLILKFWFYRAVWQELASLKRVWWVWWTILYVFSPTTPKPMEGKIWNKWHSLNIQSIIAWKKSACANIAKKWYNNKGGNAK